MTEIANVTNGAIPRPQRNPVASAVAGKVDAANVPVGTLPADDGCVDVAMAVAALQIARPSRCPDL